MKRFPRLLTKIEKRALGLFYSDFEQGVSRRALLADYFNIKQCNGISINELYVLKVIQQYDFITKQINKTKRFWKGVFNGKDPRLNKRRWKIFVALAVQLLEFGINARTYFHYCTKIRKRRIFEYYYLNSSMIMTEFNIWYDKTIKINGINPDKSIVYTDTEILKRKLLLAQTKMEDHMRVLGIKMERQYWLSLLPAWIAEYPYEFLRRNKAYKGLYIEGEMVGAGFLNPFTGEIQL